MTYALIDHEHRDPAMTLAWWRATRIVCMEQSVRLKSEESLLTSLDSALKDGMIGGRYDETKCLFDEISEREQRYSARLPYDIEIPSLGRNH
jgi:hypothetical protein